MAGLLHGCANGTRFDYSVPAKAASRSALSVKVKMILREYLYFEGNGLWPNGFSNPGIRRPGFLCVT
jgi:hypothetical protein